MGVPIKIKDRTRPLILPIAQVQYIQRKGTASNSDILYSQPFPSTRTGAIFNAFSYPTKISAHPDFSVAAPLTIHSHT